MPDYGIDALMVQYSPAGEIQNGDVRFQLKASDRPRLSRDGRRILVRVETMHLRYWSAEPMPVVLVAYDAARHRA